MQQDVNYIEHLNNVNAKFYDDKVITSSHVAIYNSLFQFWNKSFFDTDLSINRGDIMKQAKIGSVNTYLKCLKELESQGYLKYTPSHNPLIGSIINLFRFDTTPDILVIKSSTSSGTTPDKALIPYINIQTLKPKTLKLINENATLVEQCLESWLTEHNKADDSDFEEVWALYGRKGNKKNAKAKWVKIKESDVEEIKLHIPLYLKSVSESKYIKDFENYLKSEHWKSIINEDKTKPKRPNLADIEDYKNLRGIDLGNFLSRVRREKGEEGMCDISKEMYQSLTHDGKETYNELIKKGYCSVI